MHNRINLQRISIVNNTTLRLDVDLCVPNRKKENKTIQLKTIMDVQNNNYAVEIIPGLFLGSMWATLPAELNHRRITCVLNVASKECDANRGQHRLNQWKIIDLDDNVHHVERLINEVLPFAFEFLNECERSNERVLVHCVAGNSRSAAVVIAWLMKSKSMSYNSALALVQSRRSTVRPNSGFCNALAQLYG